MTRSLCFLIIGGSLATGLAACAPDTLPPPEGSAAAASPTTGGPIDGKSEPNAKISQPHSSEHVVVHYDCDNSQTVAARYPSADRATITYKGQTRPMHIAVSANGARYVGQHYGWWTHGSGPSTEATLFEHPTDRAIGDKIATCHPY